MSDHHVCELCGKSDHADYMEHCTFPEPHWAHKTCLAQAWERWRSEWKDTDASQLAAGGLAMLYHPRCDPHSAQYAKETDDE
jgi:hypothetical protein